MKAFVIMPFSEEFDDIYQIGIKETAKNEKVTAYRLDEGKWSTFLTVCKYSFFN